MAALRWYTNSNTQSHGNRNGDTYRYRDSYANSNFHSDCDDNSNC